MPMTMKKQKTDADRRMKFRIFSVILHTVALSLLGVAVLTYVQSFGEARQFALEGIHMGGLKSFLAVSLGVFSIILSVAGQAIAESVKDGDFWDEFAKDPFAAIVGLPLTAVLFSILMGLIGFLVFSAAFPTSVLEEAQAGLVEEAGYENVSPEVDFQFFYGEKGDQAYIIELRQDDGELFIDSAKETATQDESVKISK